MKKSQIVSIWLVTAAILAGCGQKAAEAVAVNFEASKQDFEAQVASIELLPLRQSPQLGFAPGLYAASDNWFLLEMDPMAEPDFRNHQLLRFDADGRFQNTVGQKGERLDEIFRIDKLQFRDGKIVVFSLEPAGGGEKAIIYDYAGNVLDARHYEFAGTQSLLLDDGVLTYYGHGNRHGREGRLMHYSAEGLTQQAFLTERTAAVNIQPGGDVLCPTGKGVVVIDTFSDTLWRYNAGVLKPYLILDLGDYALDDEFFAIEDMRESARHLFARSYAMVNRYLENGKARLVELSVQTANRKRGWIYGYECGDGWRWFRAAAPFEGSFRQLDCQRALCLLDAANLSQMSEILHSRIANPEVLETLTPEDHYVIARITFTK